MGDFEHAEIIKLYVEDEYTIREVAAQKHRSLSTIKSHLDKHNTGIIRKGYCPVCRRVSSGLDKTLAQRK